jgi:hypothetical protein
MRANVGDRYYHSHDLCLPNMGGTAEFGRGLDGPRGTRTAWSGGFGIFWWGSLTFILCPLLRSRLGLRKRHSILHMLHR